MFNSPVILADDSADVRELLRSMVTGLFTRVIEASDGRELFWAIESLLTQRCEGDPEILVVSDMYMPAYSGLDVYEAWKDSGLPVRFVLISGFPNAALRTRAPSGDRGL